MKIFKCIYTFMLCSIFAIQLYGYKVHIINDTGKEFELDAHYSGGNCSPIKWPDGGCFVGNIKPPIKPYSKTEYSAVNNEDPMGRTLLESNYCWTKVEVLYTFRGDHGETKYNTFYPMKGKSGCADLYVTIRDKGKGQYQVVAWSGASAKHKKYNEYWKRHGAEIERKAGELRNKWSSIPTLLKK